MRLLLYSINPLQALLLFLLAGCQKDVPVPDGDVPDRPIPYQLQVPAHFPMPSPFAENPLTMESVALGRRLFYDGMLSANGTVSCASCHHQELAFSDGRPLTTQGVSGRTLERHSPVLFNLAWSSAGLFWDGGSKNLESQAFGPLTHADEMAMDLRVLEERIQQHETYPELFRKAFADGPNAANAAKALAQFQRTLVSGSARYDRYASGPNAGTGLSTQEQHGLALVRQKCGSCHSGELFSDYRYHNNGIDADFSDDSHEWIHRGRYRITFDPADLGAFKTPSLRNVAVSAPYMHDGRFAGLDEVLEHYRSGIRDTPATSRILYQPNGQAGIPMTDTEKAAIVAFLHTLTDDAFLSNTSFSNPFANKK